MKQNIEIIDKIINNFSTKQYFKLTLQILFSAKILSSLVLVSSANS